MIGRRSIELPGFGHDNPIPAASRIGPFLASGALTGRDPQTRELPASLDTQCANVFQHIRALMDAAGGSPEDILKLTVHLAEYRDREALNREWLKTFPDPSSRPARQVLRGDLDGGALIHVDVLAVLTPAPEAPPGTRTPGR